ncbi:MAG: flagellar biosynthetic protein FliO [Rhodospirillales bacterium]|nr:flagellar biosynthetic protein FliO [Rhodospirillales bacterium]
MDYADYFRFLLALVFVLALIGILALLARRAGFGYPAGLARKGQTQRIQVVETAPVDGRRRLVLIRRDDVEHLLILGQNTETIIETGIRQPTVAPGVFEPARTAPNKTTSKQAEPE